MVTNDRSPKGFTLIELLITVAIIGIIASVAIPNLLGAIDRARQKRTMADLRSIATAVESYTVDLTLYPVATSMADLTPLIEPTYINNPPTDDGWGRDFSVACATGEYTLCSGGKDGGACTSDAGVATGNYNDSITFAHGQFTQWPDGPQQ